MGLIADARARRMERKLDARRKESVRIAQEIRNQLRVGSLCSDYENLFAQVRPLINDLKVVRPYGVGTNGARLRANRTPELTALDYPNDNMSWAEFADLMFATYLTEDQLFIRAHKDKRGNIIGYSFLTGNSARWNGHKIEWETIDADTGQTIILTEEDVMTLRFSRSPKDPFKGVSPATAARVWAQTDDLVAQYQRAFFENGAIPSTITFITASTKEKYDEMRTELESKTKGARNHNKTVYAWRQYQPETDEARDQIEVKTIQGSNSSLAIKDIVAIINDRLNKAVGVSNFILGDDSSAKYSNAELSDQQFIKRRVYPTLVSFWAQFQHELDRITGGLGYGIQFDLEIPDLTEQAKDKAEIAKTNAETLKTLIEAGADASAAIQALGLPDSWRATAAGLWMSARSRSASEPLNTLETKTETPTAAPSQPIAATIDSATCPCHTEDAHRSFKPGETTAKAIYARLESLAQAIIDENPNIDTETLINEIVILLSDEATAGGEQAIKILTKLTEDNPDPKMVAILEEALGRKYELSKALTERIKQRTEMLVLDFEKQTRETVRAILNNRERMTANELEEALKQVMPDGRAATIARNETVYAFRSGNLDFDGQIAEEIKGSGYHLELTWECTHDAKTCDICAAMDGKTIKYGQAFPDQIALKAGTVLPNGQVVGFAPEDADDDEKKRYTESLQFAWEHSVWNDHGKIPNAHVNCRCAYAPKVVRDE